jgi:hypothetical protein
LAVEKACGHQIVAIGKDCGGNSYIASRQPANGVSASVDLGNNVFNDNAAAPMGEFHSFRSSFANLAASNFSDVENIEIAHGTSEARQIPRVREDAGLQWRVTRGGKESDCALRAARRLQPGGLLLLSISKTYLRPFGNLGRFWLWR